MTNKQAVIYCRISDDKSDRGGVAVERQMEACELWAKNNGFTVIDRFTDNSISATKGKLRPEFERMVESAPPAIIAWHQDRIVRLTKELERVIELDVPLYTVEAGFLDLSTAQGRAVARTVTAWSTFEGEHKASRQGLAIKSFFDDGEPVPGKRRFGYLPADKNAKRRVNTKAHPTEASTIKWLFRSYADGRSVVSLAKELGWRNLRVRETLCNPSYAGYVKRRGEVRPAHPDIDRLVDSELFDAVQARLQTAKAAHHVGGVIKHALSGIARCGVCDGPLQFRNGYLCLKDLSHPFVTASILETKATRELVAALIYAPRASVPESARLHSIDLRLVALARAEEELAGALVEGMTWKAIKPRQLAVATERAELQRERASLLAQSVQASMIATLRSEVVDVQSRRASFEKAVNLKVELTKRFGALELTQRRDLFRAHLDIRVDNGRGPDRIRIEHLVAQSLNGAEAV